MASKNQLKKWHDKVIARDGRCLRCGSFGKLRAMHILPPDEYPDKAVELSNGKTYCARCKREKERFYALMRTKWYYESIHGPQELPLHLGSACA